MGAVVANGGSNVGSNAFGDGDVNALAESDAGWRGGDSFWSAAGA